MPIQWDVLRALHEMYGNETAVREFLLQYYKTPTGRAELEASPHAKMPIEDFVERLMAVYRDEEASK